MLLLLDRAPFPLYYHAAWFTTPHHKEGFEAFLDTIVAMDDVWLVTNWQAIQWMRDPTPLDRIKSFKPFGCDYPVSPLRWDLLTSIHNFNDLFSCKGTSQTV